MTALPSPILKRLPDHEQSYYLADNYVLIEFFSESLDDFFSFVLPRGLIVNGCSIPRFLWRAMGHPLMSRYWIAFVIHDYLYGKGLHSLHAESLSRKEVDLLFYDLLRADGVGWLKANEMYYGVRAGGWQSFRKDNNQLRGQDA